MNQMCMNDGYQGGQYLQIQGQQQERFLPLLGGFALGGLVGELGGGYGHGGYGYPYYGYGVPYGGYYGPYPYYGYY